MIRPWLPLLAFAVMASEFAFCQQTGNGAPVDGAAIYIQRCSQCHGPSGEGVNAVINFAGPPLQAVHDRNWAVEIIRSGKNVMPSFDRLLSPQQIDAVADFVTQKLAVISLEGGSLSEGGTLYRIYCAACHRTAMRGGALAFAGTNAPDLRGKTPSTVADAIRFGPGPMPAFPASVLNDQQVASIVAYTQYMQNPPDPGGNPLHFYGPVAEGLFAWFAVLIVVASTGWIERKGKG